MSGFGSAAAMGTLGSWHHDLIASLFFLGALLILLRREGGVTLWRAAAAGLLVGIGLGLKLTLAPFVVATVAAPLAASGPVRDRFAGLRAGRIGGGSGVADLRPGSGWRGCMRSSAIRSSRSSTGCSPRPSPVRVTAAICAICREPVGISGLSRDLQL